MTGGATTPLDPRPSLTWHTKRSESDRIWPPISAHFGTETVVRQPEGIATIAGTNESHNILKKAIGALDLGMICEIVLPRIENSRPELDEILGLSPTRPLPARQPCPASAKPTRTRVSMLEGCSASTELGSALIHFCAPAVPESGIFFCQARPLAHCQGAKFTRGK